MSKLNNTTNTTNTTDLVNDVKAGTEKAGSKGFFNTIKAFFAKLFESFKKIFGISTVVKTQNIVADASNLGSEVDANAPKKDDKTQDIVAKSEVDANAPKKDDKTQDIVAKSEVDANAPKKDDKTQDIVAKSEVDANAPTQNNGSNVDANAPTQNNGSSVDVHVTDANLPESQPGQVSSQNQSGQNVRSN